MNMLPHHDHLYHHYWSLHFSQTADPASYCYQCSFNKGIWPVNQAWRSNSQNFCVTPFGRPIQNGELSKRENGIQPGKSQSNIHKHSSFRKLPGPGVTLNNAGKLRKPKAGATMLAVLAAHKSRRTSKIITNKLHTHACMHIAGPEQNPASCSLIPWVTSKSLCGQTFLLTPILRITRHLILLPASINCLPMQRRCFLDTGSLKLVITA